MEGQRIGRCNCHRLTGFRKHASRRIDPADKLRMGAQRSQPPPGPAAGFEDAACLTSLRDVDKSRGDTVERIDLVSLVIACREAVVVDTHATRIYCCVTYHRRSNALFTAHDSESSLGHGGRARRGSGPAARLVGPEPGAISGLGYRCARP